MTAPNFMFCGKDEEILNALCAADDIASKLNSCSKISESSQNVPDSGIVSWENHIPKHELDNITMNDDCPSIHELDNLGMDSFNQDPVYQEILKNIHSIQEMCNLSVEKSKGLKEESEELMKQNLDHSKQIMSTQMLSENLENITTTSHHVLSIAKQCSHLKQVLRKGLASNSLSVNPSCQKSVIKFFELCKEMMENFKDDTKNIKACLEEKKNPKQYNVQLQLQIRENLEGLARRINDMIELRNLLGASQLDPLSKENENNTSGDMETLIDLKISPHCHPSTLNSDLLC